jgi:Spy/CpxP family protein refolding chaperone
MLQVCLLFVTVAVYAQTEERTSLTPEQRATKWTQWMKDELSISAEQETKVYEINLKYAQQAQSVRSQEGSRKSKFKEVKSIDDAKDEELKAVLTPEQFEQYQIKKRDMQKKVVKAARERRGNR